MSVPAWVEEYCERVAWEATKGVVGADSAVPDGELHDAFRRGLHACIEQAHSSGLSESMVQLSLVPDGARAVG